ncbi:hypothetical protein ASE90_12010 [Sphingomonas sp. Leaf67]|uniref:hypothetical protein n=1 Tax=Sphingomonas sp. Leaf67 TaxID=1736230 RepID=UPI0006F8C799|nr:hypothetical protein [Sphingomonas sp. Leaf67]KQN82379.1 hypothetical protein ASE90_12010 [Sphingomonas sp. Leaf67]
MTGIAVTLLTLATLIVMSIRFDRGHREIARLPMQWSLSGRVNWTAPRRLALAFTPVLAAILLITIQITAPVQTQPPGSDGSVLPALLTAALLLVVTHAIHLRLCDRMTSRMN